MTAGAGQIHAVTLRLAKLGPTGAPLAGAGNMLVVDTLVRLTHSNVYVEQQEKEVRNGRGGICLAYTAPPTVKEGSLSLQVCSPSPYITQFLAGGQLLTSGAQVGYQEPRVGEDPTPFGVSVEAWARQIDPATSEPVVGAEYAWHAFPRARFRADEQSISEDFTQPTFTGRATENPAWGDGPNNDWPVNSAAWHQWVPTSTLPTSSHNPIATPAQPVTASVGDPTVS